MIEICEPLKKDLPLLAELRLSPFKARKGERTFVGKISRDDGSYIKIWVTAAPAQFWQFEIYCAENNRIHKLNTGSGSLSGYWQTVCMFAEGLLVSDDATERFN